MEPEVSSRAIELAYTMLRPGGIMLVKEHDIDSADKLTAVNWEHHLYHVTESPKSNMDDYLRNKYVAHYQAKKKWNDLFGVNKFKLVEERSRVFDPLPLHNPDTKNATNLYWQIWNK